MKVPIAHSAAWVGLISSSMIGDSFVLKVRLFEADYTLPRTVNVRIDMRTCSYTMIRINGRNNDRSEFVSGCLPGYGRYGTIAVCGDDGCRRNYRRSARNHDRSRGANRSRGIDCRAGNGLCRWRNNDLCGAVDQRTGSFCRADHDAFDCGKRQSDDCACG